MRRDASDLLNPLLVKEVRQGLRTRVFHLSFHLLLAGCVAISCVAYGLADQMRHTQRELGYGVFGAYFACFALVGFLVVPLHAFRSFSREREADTWPILQMTGLEPRRILRGKLASALVQGALYASAIAPFLLFSYFLQGVSLALILGAMVLGLAWQALAALAGVCFATFADSRLGRGALAGILTMGLPAITIAFSSVIVTAQIGVGVPSRVTNAIILVFAWLVLTGAAVLFEAAAARLSSGGRHDMAGVRIAALLHLAGLGVVWWLPERERSDPGAMALVYACLFLFIFGLFASTEQPRAARSDKSVEGRMPLLRPGGLAGFRFTIVLVAFVTAAALELTASMDHPGRHMLHLVVTMPSLVLLLISLPIVLAGTFLPALFEESGRLRIATGVIAFGMWLLGQLDVPLLETWFSFSRWRRIEFDGIALVVLALLFTVIAERILARREMRVRAAVALGPAA